jgi:hypothetical protein
LAPHSLTTSKEALTIEMSCTSKEEATQARDEVVDEAQVNHYIVCIMRMISPHDNDYPIYLEAKRKMTQKQN